MKPLFTYPRDELLNSIKIAILKAGADEELYRFDDFGFAWALLGAGCDYKVIGLQQSWGIPGLELGPDYVQILIRFQGFSYFETGEDDDIDELRVKIPLLPDGATPPPVCLALQSDDAEFPRVMLTRLCEQAIVPQEHWENRDSAHAHELVGQAWAHLIAGTPYQIRRKSAVSDNCFTNDSTIWLDIEDDTFCLPTPARLAQRQGTD